jgi:hypothetical protein
MEIKALALRSYVKSSWALTQNWFDIASNYDNSITYESILAKDSRLYHGSH